ncbi:MAG TPA: beta-propeller fold lactonase family protein [Candidatus Angelobacter sp.]|nr:beta-propeller fold lactonase family protein [Candidatus Angelobacter sp.]
MNSRKDYLSCLLLLALFALLVGLAGCGGVSANGAISPTPTPTPSPSPSPTPGEPEPEPGPSPSPSPSPTGSPSPTPTPGGHNSASRFVFGVIDFEAEGFFGGKIDSATGQITPVAGQPANNPLGQNVVGQLLADPKGRFLYALDLGASSFGIQFGQLGISAFQINQNSGSLTPSPKQIVFPVQRFDRMVIDGTGKFLYQPDGSGIDLYSINQATGQLTQVAASVPAPPVGAFSAASSDGKFLFNEGNGLVEVYGINSANGQLINATTPISTGGSGGPILVSADSHLLFVANSSQGTVAAFSVASNGTLTALPGSPFSAGAQPQGMSLSPDGRFLYIAFQDNAGSSQVKGFLINPAAGTFTPIAGATVANATSINVDGTGKLAFISQGQQLVTFRIDPTTGALTAASQAPQPWSDIPDDVALTP